MKRCITYHFCSNKYGLDCSDKCRKHFCSLNPPIPNRVYRVANDSVSISMVFATMLIMPLMLTVNMC